MIIPPLCTGLGLITDWYGLYGSGRIDFKKSYVYLAFANNFSQVRGVLNERQRGGREA